MQPRPQSAFSRHQSQGKEPGDEVVARANKNVFVLIPICSIDHILAKFSRVELQKTVSEFKQYQYQYQTGSEFSPHGRHELNKLTSLPMCGFIAQLVEQRIGNAEVMGSNPVEALIFFSGFFFPIA